MGRSHFGQAGKLAASEADFPFWEQGQLLAGEHLRKSDVKQGWVLFCKGRNPQGSSERMGPWAEQGAGGCSVSHGGTQQGWGGAARAGGASQERPRASHSSCWDGTAGEGGWTSTGSQAGNIALGGGHAKVEKSQQKGGDAPPTPSLRSKGDTPSIEKN